MKLAQNSIYLKPLLMNVSQNSIFLKFYVLNSICEIGINYSMNRDVIMQSS